MAPRSPTAVQGAILPAPWVQKSCLLWRIQVVVWNPICLATEQPVQVTRCSGFTTTRNIIPGRPSVLVETAFNTHGQGRCVFRLTVASAMTMTLQYCVQQREVPDRSEES